MPYKYQNTNCSYMSRNVEEKFPASLSYWIFTELVEHMLKTFRNICVLIDWLICARKTHPRNRIGGGECSGPCLEGSYGVWWWLWYNGEDPGQWTRGQKGWEDFDELGVMKNHRHFQTLRMVSYKCFMRKMSRTIFLIHTSSNFPWWKLNS